MHGPGNAVLAIATNRVGVAKQMTVRMKDGGIRIIAESTSPEAAEAWKNIIRADVCAYCGGPGGTIDHIISRAMGGSPKSIRNWTGACAGCNGRRGSRGVLYFLADAADEAAEQREAVIQAAYHRRRIDIGPEIRRAIAGLPTKEARREAAEAVVKRHRHRKDARDRAWRRERKRLHRRLVGMGHTSLDDPTAVQGRRHTTFGEVNRLDEAAPRGAPADAEPHGSTTA